MNRQNKKPAARNGKNLNRADAFVLAFGAMIGWGWVVLSGDWIESAGTLGAILAFVIGGILVSFVGLVYAELSSAMPQTEGVLLFSGAALGKRASFVCTWMITLGFVAVIAFEAVALPSVLTYLFPNYMRGYLYTIAGFDVYATWLAVGIGASVLVAIINFIGIKFAAVVQTVLTVLIMVIGLFFLGGTAFNGEIANLTPAFSPGGFGGILTVAVATPFFYMGFDVIPQAAGEMDISPKKIGSVLIISVLLAVAWYIMIIFCVGCDLTHGEMLTSTLPTADAMQKAFGGRSIAGKLLVFGGVSGILSSWNAFYIAASRLLGSMAEAGMLPQGLAGIHPKFRTPYRAIIVIAVITSLTPLLGKNMLNWLSNAGSFATVITYLLVAVSFLVLRRRKPEMERPYRVRYPKFVGYGAVVCCALLLMLYLPGFPSALKWPYEWIIILAWSLLGAAMYLYANRKTRTNESTDSIVTAIGHSK